MSNALTQSRLIRPSLRATSVLLVVAVFAVAQARAAQVGDISGVRYPGWVPSDRVDPTYEVTAAYDSVSRVWRYNYVIGNESGAEQHLLDIDVQFNAPVTSVTVPAGWRWLRASPPAEIPGVHFGAKLPADYGAYARGGPSPAQIPPGQTRSGFSLVSLYPPGYARSYAQGWVPTPPLPAGYDEEDTNLPDDTTNSRRGWTLGPTRYTQVLTAGDNQAGVEGFLGFMNLRAVGTTLMNPGPFALKFSLNGETVYRESLRVLLNGVDATARFFPGPPDGADLVGVFRLGEVPGLLPGANVLVTSVDGVSTTTGQRETDLDRIPFTVLP